MSETTTPTNCLRCGRTLTSAKSIGDKYGRTCKAKVAAATQTADLAEYKPVQVAKAVEVIEQGAIVPTSRVALYLAVSSDGTVNYLVDQAEHSCTCKAGQRGIRCYHLAAADILAAAAVRKAA